ncbi:hypothetical protein IC619_010015 [Hazenella sp. IB182353]|uniref:thiamine pyrophosphate-dependent enzyme n=1 Tax=Polycladospora coralii TaxID=2771432 RepID=UPI001746F122|nr:thiamine pyrophosphate-dependent enzyme [Polycladospora coralii]MBS7530824.1 hypothetical protein [Polycladospora coralii]
MVQVNGIEAAALGLLDAQIHSAFGVFGYPANDVGDQLLQSFDSFEWSVNEKVAFELSLGISAAGFRAGVVIKQAGMSILYDPMVNAVMHGIGGGLVILAMDDIGSVKSTVEQDSRSLAKLAGVPVFDPNTASEVRGIIPTAFELSETCSIPVVVRISSRLRLSHMQVDDSMNHKNVLHTPYRVSDEVARRLSKLGRMNHYQTYTYPHILSFLQSINVGINESRASHRVGFICSSGCHTFLEGMEMPYLRLTTVWPLPEKKIISFLKSYPYIMLLEEPGDFLETQVRVLAQQHQLKTEIYGRGNGTFAHYGPLSASRIQASWRALQEQTPLDAIQSTPQMRENKAPESYLPLTRVYQVLSQYVKRHSIPVAVDVGSSISLQYPPYDIAEWGYCLGSAISVATGLTRAGKSALAVIGDYGFIHSGIQALMEAVSQQQSVKAVIIYDGVSRRTGGQSHLLHQNQAQHKNISISELVYACGVKQYEQLKVESDTSDQKIMESIARLINIEGVAVTVFELA